MANILKEAAPVIFYELTYQTYDRCFHCICFLTKELILIHRQLKVKAFRCHDVISNVYAHINIPIPLGQGLWAGLALTCTTKFLPKYSNMPATLLGRLAVDKRHRGQKLGEYLLRHALYRSLTQIRESGSIVVVVDTKE
jgi:hypothetical protein